MLFKSFAVALLLSALFHCSLLSQVLWQINNEGVIKRTYLSGDEFSGSAVDSVKWRDAYPWGRNLYCSLDQQYYTEYKNTSVENGILNLVAKRESVYARSVPYESDTARLICNGKDMGSNLRSFDYTCGMIFSRQKYHYGYYEIRFRSAEGKGLWPAFWLYAGHETDEIDIFELNGSRNNDMHVDVHCKSGCNNYKTTLGFIRKNWGDYLKTSSNWNSGFNVVSLEWQPGYLKWFLNGKAIAYWRGKFEYPMWVIAGIGIAQDEAAFGPGPDASTRFPASMEVDYIRIWSQPSAENSGNINRTLLDMPSDISEKQSVLVKGTRPESNKKIISEAHSFILFARTDNNNYAIEVSGTVPANISIEIRDPSSRLVPVTTSVKNRLYRFRLEGNGFLKIKTGNNVIEHSF